MQARVHCARTTLFDQRSLLPLIFLLLIPLVHSLSLTRSPIPLPPPVFPFALPFRFYRGENWPQLRWPGFPEIAITKTTQPRAAPRDLFLLSHAFLIIAALLYTW